MVCIWIESNEPIFFFLKKKSCNHLQRGVATLATNRHGNDWILPLHVGAAGGVFFLRKEINLGLMGYFTYPKLIFHSNQIQSKVIRLLNKKDC